MQVVDNMIWHCYLLVFLNLLLYPGIARLSSGDQTIFAQYVYVIAEENREKAPTAEIDRRN